MTEAATSAAAGTIRNAIRLHPGIKGCSNLQQMEDHRLTRTFLVTLTNGAKFFIAVTEVEEDDQL